MTVRPVHVQEVDPAAVRRVAAARSQMERAAQTERARVQQPNLEPAPAFAPAAEPDDTVLYEKAYNPSLSQKEYRPQPPPQYPPRPLFVFPTQQVAAALIAAGQVLGARLLLGLAGFAAWHLAYQAQLAHTAQPTYAALAFFGFVFLPLVYLSKTRAV